MANFETDFGAKGGVFMITAARVADRKSSDVIIAELSKSFLLTDCDGVIGDRDDG